MQGSWRTPAVVLACGTIILFISFGARNIFGLLLDPMTTSLGWSVASFSDAVSIQLLVWGLTTPITAALADRFGTAKMVGIGGALYAAGMFLTAHVTTPGEMTITAGFMMGLGLSATGFPMILAAVTKRVDAKRRSLFLGIGSAAGSSGQLALVPLGQFFISGYDWMVALMAFAAIVAAIVMLSFALADPRRETGPASGPQQALGAALREACSHRGFILLTAGYFVCGFQVQFLGNHFPKLLLEEGQTAWVGAMAISIIGFTNIIGTLAWGAMGGRWRMKNLLSMIYILRSAVMTLFFVLPITATGTYLFSAAIGFLWLATVPLTTGLVARIFGIRYMATLTGLVFFSHQLGSFFGVWLGGKLFTQTGSYDTIWWTAVGLGLVAALLHYPIDDRPVVRTATQGA
ncbi:MAG: MFS transporter [Rhodospirillaceae bacterium]